jgi:hypothetical protein
MMRPSLLTYQTAPKPAEDGRYHTDGIVLLWYHTIVLFSPILEGLGLAVA